MKAEAELERFDRIFAALSHRTRRQIVFILHLRGGRMTGREVAERFSCRWPTVSRHLSVLREAGLVSVSREGRERIYSVDMSEIEAKIRAWFKAAGG
jgi:DNA-binding transcriptional ArsR family regulator